MKPSQAEIERIRRMFIVRGAQNRRRRSGLCPLLDVINNLIRKCTRN